MKRIPRKTTGNRRYRNKKADTTQILPDHVFWPAIYGDEGISMLFFREIRWLVIQKIEGGFDAAPEQLFRARQVISGMYIFNMIFLKRHEATLQLPAYRKRKEAVHSLLSDVSVAQWSAEEQMVERAILEVAFYEGQKMESFGKDRGDPNWGSENMIFWCQLIDGAEDILDIPKRDPWQGRTYPEICEFFETNTREELSAIYQIKDELFKDNAGMDAYLKELLAWRTVWINRSHQPSKTAEKEHTNFGLPFDIRKLSPDNCTAAAILES